MDRHRPWIRATCAVMIALPGTTAPAMAGTGDAKVELEAAAARGDADAVRAALARGGSPSGNPLVFAVQNGHGDVVRLLVAAGADVNAASDVGNPLHAAIASGRTDMLSLLLDQGAIASGRSDERLAEVTPLGLALGVELRVVEALLDYGVDPNELTTDHLVPPLASAALTISADRPEKLRLLLAAGADLERRGRAACVPGSAERECTPLATTAAASPDAIAEVYRGALRTMGCADASETAPQASACTIVRPATDPAFVRRMLLDSARILIEAGADVNAPTASGKTPLVLARASGQEELVKLLLRHGARDAAAAAPEPPGGDRYRPGYAKRRAVVVGINAYRQAPPLEGAVGDAKRVAAALRALGFDDVKELYDGEATREVILRAFGDETVAASGRDDLVVLYFAGHGQTETRALGVKRGYIVPVDARMGDYASAISMAELRDLSRRIPAKHLFYVMDSCYSGLGLTRGGGDAGGAYAQKLTSLRAVQMLAAGMEGELAIEQDGQGLFTRHFLDAIGGAADFDRDGAVTASEIGTFVRPRVSQASLQRQTPMFGSLEGSGEVVFAKP